MDTVSDLDQEELSAPSPTSSSQPQSPIDSFDVQKYVGLYPYASEPSYFTRANRYHGPPSTWYSWTADDRAVAEALDASRTRDLSIHLYNAFDLKRRHGRDLAAESQGTKSGSRSRETKDDGGQPAGQQFTPPEIWTAWPLRAFHVPRTSSIREVHRSTHSSPSKSKPSASLEDALLAATLRYAKDRWNDRQDEKNSPSVTTTKRNWEAEREFTKNELLHSSGNQDNHDDKWPELQDPDVMSESEIEQNLNDDQAAVNDNLPEGVQFFSSQAFGALDSSSPTEDEKSLSGSEGDYPVFSADEDLAREILMPFTRHILTKVDDLLGGLHKARLAYTVKETSPRSRSRSLFSSTEEDNHGSFVRSRSRTTSERPRRKRKRSPSETSVTEEVQASRSRDQSTVRKFGKKGQGYGLRDWSDILGMATLTGWNTETVSRAAARCASLFNQNMTFRTFQQRAQDEPWFEEESAYVPTVTHDPTHPTLPNPASSTHLEIQHAIDYVRVSPACSRCKLLKLRCDPPRPLESSNPSESVSCTACASTPDIGESCSGIKIQQVSSQTSKTCPYPDCPRHSLAKQFSKHYHLQRHLKNVHGHLYTPPDSPFMNYLAMDNDDEKFELAIREQIKPTDTLTCPVPSCPRNAHIYKRSTRLYNHVKRQHPEVDMASLRKTVARSSKRGRYDRSRSRSRVRHVETHDQQDNESGSQHSDKPGDHGEFEDHDEDAN